MSTKDTIEITDAGPIEALSIPCGPGIVVLRGENDIGKSEALKLCDKLAGGKHRVTKRHDAVGPGSVKGLGATITLAGSTRQTGELEALTLAGRFNVGELIEPPIKAPEAADKARIKAFLAMTGVEADIQLFEHAGIDVAVPLSTLEAPDLVDMAARLKKDCEQEARKHEDFAKYSEGQVVVHKESAKGIDVEGECDADTLQQSLEAAIGEQSRLDEQRRAAFEEAERISEAKEQLTEAESDYQGSSVEEANKNLDGHIKIATDATCRVQQLEAELEKARRFRATAEVERDSASRLHIAASQSEKLIARCRSAIDSATDVCYPSTEERDEATQAVTDARKAVEQGVLIRKAREDLRLADKIMVEGRGNRRAADGFRKMAKATDGVLSDAVQSEELTVKDGRLVTQKDGREVFFAERSRGVRCRIAMTIAATAIRREDAEKVAVIVLPQEHWEGLDLVARRTLDDHIRQLDVTVITAEASSREGDPLELTATTFGETT